MVSIIIPIYNVAPYLKQCIDSVISQTYKDLEILLIDDGSTDGSEEICESYNDDRVVVFHNKNSGLSAARNYGIKEAHGEYLYFLDSDDWIDGELIESAVTCIGDADILCFEKNEGEYNGYEALLAHIKGKISSTTWSKLYRRKCFSAIRFPEGRVYEDISTTYKLLYQARFVICCNIIGHHHRHRENSISHQYNTNNLIDRWIANKERFETCAEIVDTEAYTVLLGNCADAITQAWARRYDNTISDSPEWELMSDFLRRRMMPYSALRHLSFQMFVGIMLARVNHPLSFWLANKASLIKRKLNREN